MKQYTTSLKHIISLYKRFLMGFVIICLPFSFAIQLKVERIKRTIRFDGTVSFVDCWP